jgi:hypothetical protein
MVGVFLILSLLGTMSKVRTLPGTTKSRRDLLAQQKYTLRVRRA